MPAAGYEHDFNSCTVGAAQGCEVSLGNLELWIEECAVDIGRQQPDRG